jgi:glycosyltransferase involved in cell wall biosynthesis
MKFLHVIPDMDPQKGGVSQGLRNLIPALESLGGVSEVVCPEADSRDPESPDPCLVHRTGKADNPWSWQPDFSRWMREHVMRFDVVIVHGLWQYPGFATANIIARQRLSGQSQTPLFFIMPHGMLDPWFQTEPSRTYKAFRNRIYWRLIERRVIARADALLFTSAEEKRLAATTFPHYRPRREIVVGFGTGDVPEMTDGMAAILQGQCPGLGTAGFLLFLGRIDPKKGIDILIRAFADSGHGAGGNPPTKLLIAGPGWSSTYGRSLRACIDADPYLREHIIVSGMLQGDAKWAALRLCEAFILPSHQENFGVAVAEALSCGKPVLISDKVNTWPEILANGAGYVENDSEEGVGKLLADWKALPASGRAAMQEAASRTYAAHFRMEDCARSVMQAAESCRAVQATEAGRGSKEIGIPSST